MEPRLAAEPPFDKGPAATGAFRIGINLFALTLGGGGMRQYVLQLLPWLLRLSGHHLVVFYHLQGWPSLATLLRGLRPAERCRVRTIEIDSQEQVFAHADAFDVYFAPLNCLAPDLLDRPSLSTLADVQEQFFPEYFTPQQLRDRAQLYPHTARAATVLLTISEFSKRSICKAFAVPAEKVRVTHLAPADDFTTWPARWPRELGEPPGRFVFYPANLYPHKRHVLLLDAIGLLRDRGTYCSCILTGQPADPGIDIKAEITARGLGGIARWLPHVGPGELRFLYENALALCFPSQFEGFGLPLVEAMACGCPVVATSAASVPEVVADAAMLIEPSAEAFADAIATLLADPARRQDLAARGRHRAAHFSSRKVAQETLEAIEDAVVAFAAPRPVGLSLSFVVRPGRGGRDLIETLTSLAFEVEPQDEVLVLAAPGNLDEDAQLLCKNLGVVRFVPSGGWVDRVKGDAVWRLAAGQRVAEGASRAALAALAAGPSAVVGHVLRRGPDGALAGSLYLPPADATTGWSAAPECAVVWRTSFVRQCEAARCGWAAAALAQADNVAVCYRTFAITAAPSGLAGSTSKALRGLGAPGRALARRLPAQLRNPLRRLYRRVIAAFQGST